MHPSRIDRRDRVPGDARHDERILGGDPLGPGPVDPARHDRAPLRRGHGLPRHQERPIPVMTLQELDMRGDEPGRLLL
jgi:hypothetical protein